MRLRILTSMRTRSRIFSSIIILLIVNIYSVISETQWVWSQNRVPHTSGGNGGSSTSSFTNNNNPNFGPTNIFPESPRPPSQSDNLDNNALPLGTIRVVNSQGEARLIPGAANFVSNALNSLGGGSSGGGSAGASGGGGGGLLSIGSGLVSSILQSGPQLIGSAINLLLNRNPSGGGSSGSSPAATLPGIPTFPSSPGGGGGGGIGSIIGSGGGSSSPSISGGSSSGSCRCVALNLCFLPSRPNGDCAGGNIQCCSTSQNTRAISNGDLLGGSSGIRNSDSLSPLDVRIGLLENVVRGSSAVFDDALDLVLQRWLTQEDQQKLANRIATNRIANGR